MSTDENEEGNQYINKWNILFGRTQSHWMLLDAEEGAYVYPCYACRDLFSSKTSFVDHVNRISIGLKYLCPGCNLIYTFYNPCMLLLHARTHFQTSGGVINLDNVYFYRLPAGLIGFPPHPGVPLIFDVKEEDAGTSYINSNFYNAMGMQKGLKYIKLVATFLLFVINKNGDKVTMVLKQVCSNIPKCMFVVTRINGKCTGNESLANLYNSSTIDDSVGNPVCNNICIGNVNVTEIKSVDVDPFKKKEFKCPECEKVIEQSSASHFRQANLPLNPDLQCEICKFIAPGECSLKAHNRMHTETPPFVCPECGITFEKFVKLLEHENESCYHFSKQVKFKCNKKHCSKIFTFHANFKKHFEAHIQRTIVCPDCDVFYLSRGEFNTHQIEQHRGERISFDVVYQCTVCDGETFDEEEYSSHIEEHCDPNKLNNKVYVHMCPNCRNYFRTASTFATHTQRCNKKDMNLTELVSMKFTPAMTYCDNCGFLVHFKVSLTSCPKCGSKENLHHHISDSIVGKKIKCSLCNDPTSPQHVCKFEKPIVLLRNLGDISNTVVIPDKIEKRKRQSSPNQIAKKKTTQSSHIINLEIPKPFTGIYSCKLCEFSSEERGDFHHHLMSHRDGIVYQCMECGESFVVKPSFEKHLIYFHQITDVDKYIVENDCCDKDVEDQLRKNSEEFSSNEPLEENQCEVCREKFEDANELKKHFRGHGMAFLLNKSKSSK